jgi:hypothetical protein
MIGGARNHPFEIAKVLGLPSRVFVVFGMTLGHPDWDRVPPHRPRLDLGAIIHHERYDDSRWSALHSAYDGEMLGTGIYDKRRIHLAGRVEGWRDDIADGEYGWIEHSARRWIDPSAQRRDLRPFLDFQQFGFE